LLVFLCHFSPSPFSQAYALGNMTTGGDTPWVHSLSYGMSAANVDPYLGKGYLARSDVEFKKLALRGFTIIIADGDVGAGDLGAPPMSIPTCERFNADWPSQSAYITAVGSTYATPAADPICYKPADKGGIDCTAGGMPLGEVGVSLANGILFTTGGGFAGTVLRPWYQKAVVDTYLSLYNTAPTSMFNPEGRGYPDVATSK
jgi:tripeptidyl-peptidase-1